MKKLFEPLTLETDNFIFSCAEDPNLCQISLHKEWTDVLFAWVRVDGIFLFRFPKEFLLTQTLPINHADGDMQRKNELFQHSLRLKNKDIQLFTEFLIDIIE